MGGIDDFGNRAKRLQQELGRIDQHDEADIPLVKRFVARMDKHTAESTLKTYLQNLRKTSERIDQPISTLTGPDVEEHVYDLRRNPEYGLGDDPGLSDTTVHQIEFVLRKFFRELDIETDGWEEEYELITPPSTTVSPDDMLTAEDIASLREGANNMRDIALIEFLADTGARIGLVASLRVGDVDLDGVRATFTPNPNAKGLKGATIQEYPIIDSLATLRQYLSTTHPRPNEDGVALFHQIHGHGNDALEGDGALSLSAIHGALRRAANNSGLDKPANPHNFRHSAVTRMAREGYTRSQIEHRVMWSIDTDMWEIYEHIAGEQHNDDIFEAAGVVETDEDSHTRERHPCGNCGEQLAPHHKFCPRCASPATPETRDRFEAAIQSLSNGQAGVEDLDRRQRRAALTQGLFDNASILGAHESASSSSD